MVNKSELSSTSVVIDGIEIPNGDAVVHDGDLVSVMTTPRNAALFFQKIGLKTTQVRDAMLIGGGTIAWDYNGLWIDPNFGVWLVQGGTINFGYTGFFSDPNFGDQYVEAGQWIEGGNG